MEQKTTKIKRKHKLSNIISVIFFFVVCIIAFVISLPKKEEEIIYLVEEGKNEIFTEDFFRNVESIELRCTYRKGEDILTDKEDIQRVVTLLSQLTLSESTDDIDEIVGRNALRFVWKDGTVKGIPFTGALIGLKVDEKKITYELEEGAHDKIMALFD